MMLAGIAGLTLALVIVGKLFMSDDTAAVPEPAVGRQQLFKEPDTPSGLNPAARSESSSSGGGLDMFSQTNAGFYGEGKSTAAAEEQAAPAVVRSTKPAAGKAAAGKAAAKKAKPKGAVIPRLKPTSFDKTPTNVSPGGAKQGMPDISEMMKQMKQQGGNKNPPGN